MAFKDYTLFGGYKGYLGKSIFEKTPTPEPRLLETPSQRSASSTLQSYLDAYGGSTLTGRGAPYRSYEGQRIAPLTGTEASGQTLLGDYAKSAAPSSLGLAMGELGKTFGEDYDVFASPYYKNLREGLQSEQDRELEALSRSQQMRGVYRGTGAVREEALARGDFTSRIGAIMGALQEAERARKLSAVPQALEAGRAQENVPLSRLAAVGQYGALPRNVEQAGYDTSFQDFLRQLMGEQGVLGTAQDTLSNAGNRDYYQPSFQPSMLEQLLSGAAKVGQAATPFLLL